MDKGVPRTSQTTKLGRFVIIYLKIGVCLFLSGILIFLVRTTFTSYYRVDGGSMEPTMKDAEIIQTSPFSSFNKYLSKLKRGDIVIFMDKEKKVPHVKRVIGLPNEIVTIDNSHIFIDSNLLNEPYLFIKYYALLQKIDFYVPPTIPCIEYRLDGDEYFVLGDNRDNSSDSRGSGPINIKSIKAFVKYSSYNNNQSDPYLSSTNVPPINCLGLNDF